MSTGEPSPILIAGGGIGGLATAVALARKGIATCVLERGPVAPETGAGIQLGPNATRILRHWGLEQTLAAAASFPESVTLFDGATGRRLNAVPLGDTALARYGAPYCTLHRADLHRLLLDAAAKEALVTLMPEFEVQRVLPTEGGVEVLSANGRKMHGLALIGADGIRSAVRSVIAKGWLLVDTGQSAWRLLLPAEDMPPPFGANLIGLWFHPNGHLVHYPAEAGRSLNIVAITKPGHSESPPNFSLWPKPVNTTLVNRAGWQRWPLLEMKPLPHWSQGRITLLGDAAHPVLPFLASGGVLAIEDAAILAEEAAKTPRDLPSAFQRYEALRRPRVLKVMQHSRRMGKIYHMTGLPRLARNIVLSAMPQSLLLARSDWLYRFSPDGYA